MSVMAAKRTFFCRAKPNAQKNNTRVSRSPGENTAAANGLAENDDVLDRFSFFAAAAITVTTETTTVLTVTDEEAGVDEIPSRAKRQAKIVSRLRIQR